MTSPTFRWGEVINWKKLRMHRMGERGQRGKKRLKKVKMSIMDDP
jgi:hypothetical protein